MVLNEINNYYVTFQCSRNCIHNYIKFYNFLLGKMKSESNFLDFLRGGNDSTMTGRRYNADESDSGHGSPTRELDDDEPSIRKPSFWRRFTIKGARNKR